MAAIGAQTSDVHACAGGSLDSSSTRFRTCVSAGAVLADGAGDLSSSSDGSKAGSSSSSSDRPIYTHVAALQELALVLDIDPASSSSSDALSAEGADGADRRLLLSAANTTSKSNSSAASAGTLSSWRSQTKDAGNSSTKAVRTGAVTAPPAAAADKAIVRPVAPDANSTDSSSTLDLDPPFRPLVDRYIALLPPGPAAGQLMMSSSRWGDVVVVDTTACGDLDSARCVAICWHVLCKICWTARWSTWCCYKSALCSPGTAAFALHLQQHQERRQGPAQTVARNL